MNSANRKRFLHPTRRRCPLVVRITNDRNSAVGICKARSALGYWECVKSRRTIHFVRVKFSNDASIFSFFRRSGFHRAFHETYAVGGARRNGSVFETSRPILGSTFFQSGSGT